MSRPDSAREALLAEAIGDLAHLLDRAEALKKALREAQQAMTQSHAQLAGQLAGFEAQVSTLCEGAKVQVAKHIVLRTEEATRQSRETQTRAMADAARTLFEAEVGPALQRLAMPLLRLVQRVDRPWEQWLTHAATAAAASAITWMLAAYLWAR